METELVINTATSTGEVSPGMAWLCLIVGVLMLASMWKIFTKAKKPGWAAIIPIYNTIVMLEIIGKPWYWLLLLLVPGVNIVIAIMMSVAVAKCFGKSGAWGFFMLIVFSFIGHPILAFGGAKYKKVK
jgi:hypothetical protein